MQSFPPKDGAPYWDRIDVDPAFREWVAKCDTPSAGGLRLGHHQPQGPWTGAWGRYCFSNACHGGRINSGSRAPVSHQQNIVIPHVAGRFAQCSKVTQQGRYAQHRLGFDLIVALYTTARSPARSIPIGQAIAMRYHDRAVAGSSQYQNIGLHQCLWASPCRRYRHPGAGWAGVENYQVTLGGRSGLDNALGEKLAPDSLKESS